jgi:hypothetical protein
VDGLPKSGIGRLRTAGVLVQPEADRTGAPGIIQTAFPAYHLFQRSPARATVPSSSVLVPCVDHRVCRVLHSGSAFHSDNARPCFGFSECRAPKSGSEPNLAMPPLSFIPLRDGIYPSDISQVHSLQSCSVILPRRLSWDEPDVGRVGICAFNPGVRIIFASRGIASYVEEVICTCSS